MILNLFLSVPRFVIPNFRFKIGICSLLAFSVGVAASTPGFDTLVNYDTAWTFVYDGGRLSTGKAIGDDFYDIKCLTNGTCVCVGESGDTTGHYGINLVKIDPSGKIIWKKLLNGKTIGPYQGGSIEIAKNGDYLVGGLRYTDPWVLRTDTAGNIKWQTWLYDTINKKSSPLSRGATINSLLESSRGTIVCAAGDPYPYNGGSPLNDYAAYLEFDSLGKLINYSQWRDVDGYNIGGFSLAETHGKNLLLAGNEAVFYLDSVGNADWQKTYSFQLDGVGSVVNNIRRVKVLRVNTPIVMGQAYEGNCWTRFQKLYYDAWWSPIQYESGLNTNWDTAGMQGGDDNLYDFTQLNNGNLVFVGKSGYSSAGGIWAFVTDSSGKGLFWEKQIRIPYKTADGRAPRPLSVCATADGGFTVVGDYACNDSNGGVNAFAAHFIPAPVSAVSRKYTASKSTNDFNVYISRARLVVSRNASTKTMGEVSVFDISGRCVATKAGNKEIVFDISKLSFGTYFVRVKSGASVQTVKICLNR